MSAAETGANPNLRCEQGVATKKPRLKLNFIKLKIKVENKKIIKRMSWIIISEEEVEKLQREVAELSRKSSQVLEENNRLKAELHTLHEPLRDPDLAHHYP